LVGTPDQPWPRNGVNKTGIWEKNVLGRGHLQPAQVQVKQQGAQIQKHLRTNAVNQWSRTKKNSTHYSKPRKPKNDVRKGFCVLTPRNRRHTPNTGHQSRMICICI
jgi:hypothetical protein